MVFRKRVFPLFVLLITAALLLTACERPTPGSDETATDADTAVTEETSDDTADSDATVEETTEDAATESSDSTEAAAETEDAAAAETSDEATDAAAEETADSTDAADDEADDTTTAEEETAESAETEAADDAAAEDADAEAAKDEMSAERPSTHVVAKGENLFRIGLKYGMSWITLAQYNKIMNPHMVYVGQVIHIPPVYEPMQDKDAMHENMSDSATTEDDEEEENTQEDSDTEDEDEAETESSADSTSSVATETTYQVHPGDNLFRIGLKYNVNWMQIAEANGIMNANYIKVGQTLKIPVSAPGPMPPFTHHVRYGETLFRISMQYGVKWTEIAAENEIKSPYVIYPGQMLQIPGK